MVLEHVAVLINPAAGAGRGTVVGRRVAGHLRARGVQVEVLTGSTAATARQLAATAVSDGVDAVLACGGDGLVHAAIQSLAGTASALGVIPCGSGNDFARSLRLPLDSPRSALEVVVTEEPRLVDLGRAGDRLFAGVVASGFDSRVNDRANRMRWPPGALKYNLAMVAELAAFRPIRYRLRLDDDELDISAMLVAVGNGPSYGGGMQICPSASMADGLLDVTVISELSRTRLLQLTPSVYRGRHTRYPEVLEFRVTEVSLAARAVNAYADGEFIAPLPIICTAMPRALRVFAPYAQEPAGSTVALGEQGATGPRAGQSPPEL